MSQPENHASNDFSSRFLRAVKMRGWDRADVARLTGAPWSTVQRWFDGATPRGEAMLKLATALRVNIAWLRDGIEPMLIALSDPGPTESAIREQGVGYRGSSSRLANVPNDELWHILETGASQIPLQTMPIVRDALIRDIESAAHELKTRLSTQQQSQ